MQNLTSTQIAERIYAARTLLATATATLDETTATRIQVTPEWDASDILRHIAAWNNLALTCLDDWRGERPWLPIRDPSFDAFNQRMVNERREASVEALIDTIQKVYQRYLACMEQSGVAELNATGKAPWGEVVSRMYLIYDMIAHDEEHLAALITARG